MFSRRDMVTEERERKEEMVKANVRKSFNATSFALAFFVVSFIGGMSFVIHRPKI